MADISKLQIGSDTYNIVDETSGYTTNTGTVTSVATSTGLSGGTITTTGTLSLKTASSSEIGGVKVSATAQTVAANAVSSTAGKTYAVQLDGNDNAVVNVPWEGGGSDTKVTQTVTNTGDNDYEVLFS